MLIIVQEQQHSQLDSPHFCNVKPPPRTRLHSPALYILFLQRQNKYKSLNPGLEFQVTLISYTQCEGEEPSFQACTFCNTAHFIQNTGTTGLRHFQNKYTRSAKRNLSSPGKQAVRTERISHQHSRLSSAERHWSCRRRHSFPLLG